MAATGNNAYLFNSHPEAPANVLQSAELVEQHLQLPTAYATSSVSMWMFDGICMRHSVHTFKDYFSFEKKNTEDIVSLEFNIRGNFSIQQEGQVYDVKSGQHNIIYANGFENTFQNRDLQAESFKIELKTDAFVKLVEDSNDTLKRFADQLLVNRPLVISSQSLNINLPLQKALHEVLHCRYTGGLKKLFLLSKSIEILVLQAAAFHEALQQGGRSHKRQQDDKERVMYAREYLVKHVETPPSLSELSRIVGLNEFKLKKSFKETFNTTVFGYLSDYRLDLARQTLLDSKRSISDIAYELGYSSPQHFSMAFRKKFGVPPREVRK